LAGLLACISVHYFLWKYHFLIAPFFFLSSRFHKIDPSKCRENQGLAVSMTLQQSVAVNMTLQQSVAFCMALQKSVAVSMALQNSVAVSMAL
jgi:hypothetical protein